MDGKATGTTRCILINRDEKQFNLPIKVSVSKYEYDFVSAHKVFHANYNLNQLL